MCVCVCASVCVCRLCTKWSRDETRRVESSARKGKGREEKGREGPFYLSKQVSQQERKEGGNKTRSTKIRRGCRFFGRGGRGRRSSARGGEEGA